MWLIGFFLGMAISAGVGGGSGWHIPIGGIIGAIIAATLSSYVEDLLEDSRKEKEEQKRKQEEARKAAETARQLKEIQRQQELFVERQYNVIKAKYPLGLSLFEKINSFDDGKNSAELTHEEIIGCTAEISKLQQSAEEAESYNVWEKEQSNFSSKCYEINKTVCPYWGRYVYDIPYNRKTDTGEQINGKHRIWHFFCDSGCLDFSLDYTHFANYKRNGENFDKIKKATYYLDSNFFNQVEDFVGKLDNPLVIYRNDFECLSFYLYTQDSYKNTNVNKLGYNASGLSNDPAYDNLVIPDSRVIVIYDLLTKNEDLFDLCSYIFNKYAAQRPLICYISLCKYFSSFEMKDLIERKNQELRKIKEEKEKQSKAIDHCLSVVKEWDRTKFNLPYKYLVDYYPTTCDFEANKTEWNNRWLIWDFKNTPGKTSEADHKEALDSVVQRVSSLLINKFGHDNLKYLTLVCIPASSQDLTKARYEDFSRILCEKTGLTPSFDKIYVVQNKIAKREGGATISSDILQFDESFFKGKHVILFDDVITSGKSMNAIKSKLNQLGASVICGLSIGKTKHTRSNQHSKPTLDDLYKQLFED